MFLPNLITHTYSLLNTRPCIVSLTQWYITFMRANSSVAFNATQYITGYAFVVTSIHQTLFI